MTKKFITQIALVVFFILITFGVGQTAQAAVGETWVSRASAADNTWTSVTYGNGLFVAVAQSGQGNRVMTSLDGITWTSRTAAANNAWTSVTYGNGLFVAVASSGGIRNRVMTSPDGITWTIRHSASRDIPRTTTLPDGSMVYSTSTFDSNWSAVTYNNGLFVAVGYDYDNFKGTVMTSPDGITWTTQTAAANNQWTSVTYGNGLFVAVSESGQGNRVMTSPDGITWTSRTAAANNAWTSVTYGNGLFVAVSSQWPGSIDNRVMTSPDGITWTSRTAAADGYWQSVTYGDGLFVAVSASESHFAAAVAFAAGLGTLVMTSPDGITWTSRTAAADNLWTSVTYGNGLFVAVSKTGSGNRVMTSNTPPADLTVENLMGVGVFETGQTITFSGDVTNSGARAAATSTVRFCIDDPNSCLGTSVISGITPGGTVSAITTTWTATVGAHTLYMCADVTGAVAESDETNNCTSANFVVSAPIASCGGSVWTSRTAASNNFWNSVTYGNGLFVAVASSEGIRNRVMTSPDGITWTSQTSAVDNNWTSVTYGNGLFVAVSSSFSSPLCGDGSVQQGEACDDGNRNNGDNCSSSCQIGPGTAGGVMTSPDGITWTSRTAASNNFWNSVTYGNGLFVAISEGTAVMTSSDGITWTSRTAAAHSAWRSVTYGNGLFVAVAASGPGSQVMTSPDGITWTSRTAAVNNIWDSVTYGNGLFVAVSMDGNGNRVMTSPDGITWTSRTAAADKVWNSVTYGNGLFVAVAPMATDNHVMTSPDGITWTGHNAINSAWTSVTYGNGLFVAVAMNGAGNLVMTSPACISNYPNLTSTFTLDPSISFTKNESIDLSAVTNNDSTIDITTSFTDEFSYSWDNGATWESLATFNHDVIPVAPPTFGPLPPPVSLLAGDSVTNTVSYTPNQSGTLLLQHCVDVDDAIEEDVGEIPNCTQVSVPVRGAEIQESGGCIISDGAGDSCYGFLIWNVINPIGDEVSVYNVQIEDAVASGAEGNNVPILLRKGINEIRIQDGSDVLATVVLGAECYPTSVWDAENAECVPRPSAPEVNVETSAVLIRSGKQVTAAIDITANYDLACTVYGVDGAPQYFDHNGGVGVTNQSYLTRSLYSAQMIDVICVDTLGIVTHEKTKVRVMPKIWEN